MVPGYIKLYNTGVLQERAREAVERLGSCDLCPWSCQADRVGGKLGACKTGRDAILASYAPHFGEERPLVGRRGSGTIFFSSCNMRCVYCQNYDISHLKSGYCVSADRLAEIMVELQALGCHNINFVSPSHVIAQILEALVIAVKRGLKVPLVYNTGGYESIGALTLLDGVVDIYMPDIKYNDATIAERFSGVKNYPQVAADAVIEMHRQVGDLFFDERGIALRGILVRHLILPENLAGTEEVIRFLAEKVSKDTYVNIMDQYYPCYKATGVVPLNRRITASEYESAIRAAERMGLTRLDQ